MNYEKLPKTISAEELLSTPLPPVKWIIPDLLPAGLALFAGPSKAGKSWLTLWLCLQVAQGKPMWGREIEPHTVLYLSLEDTFNRLQKRLLQLVGSEEAPERLVMQTECGSIGQGLEEQLTSFLYQHPDTGLIVIDTLQKVRSNDQNNSMYASDYKEISALKALADKYNICILLIHHLRKQAADDPFQQIAGSNGLMGASDTSWVMQRKRMSQTASILVTGRDMDNKTLRLHEENCVWILDEEESTEQIVAKAVPSYLWKVADYIDSVGTWQGTATELLSAADIEGVLPHQLTRKIVEHFDTVFTPRGIRYETHRTSQARQMKFSHDGNDADDANDAEIDITQLFKWDISQTASSASSASLASQRSRKESEQPIFTDPDVHVPHPDTFTRHLRKLYKKCGLPAEYHLHTLRHFYATYLLQEGTSKQVTASLLGHADTAFLERTYCHPQDVAKQQAANLMQDLLNNQNPCYVAFMKNRNRKPKKAG